MTRSGQDTRRPPQAPASAGSRGPARLPQTSGRDNHAALRLIGLGVLWHMLRSRRLYERATIAAIVLAALAGMGQEQRARNLARLTAWNKRQVQLFERKTERQARRLERKVKGA